MKRSSATMNGAIEPLLYEITDLARNRIFNRRGAGEKTKPVHRLLRVAVKHLPLLCRSAEPPETRQLAFASGT